ncbi:hypothetical protein FN846DRAFT_888157 [Sphaerosporella brunnea]|uniref:AAA-ATPase-like domain-containing protein n=1 Tax=Sphaerosporella brunnea TaxID=1250544 RepID=A0A5J5F381_9PEZI|nr:hypothetical protein FN846DRAFT_888157 [Sphaerosporella brunnea]
MHPATILGTTTYEGLFKQVQTIAIAQIASLLARASTTIDLFAERDEVQTRAQKLALIDAQQATLQFTQELWFHAACRDDPQAAELLRDWQPERIWSFLDLDEALKHEGSIHQWKPDESPHPHPNDALPAMLMGASLRSSLPSQAQRRPFEEADWFAKRATAATSEVRVTRRKRANARTISTGLSGDAGRVREEPKDLEDPNEAKAEAEAEDPGSSSEPESGPDEDDLLDPGPNFQRHPNHWKLTPVQGKTQQMKLFRGADGVLNLKVHFKLSGMHHDMDRILFTGMLIEDRAAEWSTFSKSNSKPTREQVQAFDRDRLLAWVTVQRLTSWDDNLEKFRTANIDGSVFLECDYDFFRKEVGLDIGIAKALDILVKRIKGSKNEGLKRDSEQAELALPSDTAFKKVLLDSEVEAKRPPVYHSKTHLGFNIYQTTGNGQKVLDPHLPTMLQSLPHYLLQPGLLFVDKTKYIEILDQTNEYAYMFLRPRRFGKSTFLNMLCTYYDIAQADKWENIFGGLYIGNNPTASRSKHLVLRFDLSGIDISGGISLTRQTFHDYLNIVLSEFLVKYRHFLGGKNTFEGIICRESGTASLYAVLTLVKKSGYTLFVGVDEYDAPANNAAFDGTGLEYAPRRSMKVAAIESFFKAALFFAFERGQWRRRQRRVHLEILPHWRAACISGWNESSRRDSNDIRVLAKNYLALDDSSPLLEQICWSMRKYYNGYYFAKSQDHGLELRYNPQLVYNYLEEIKTGGQVSQPEESPAVHTTNILASIADNGAFSVDDIVKLMAAGSISSTVRSEFGFSDLVGHIGEDKAATLSLLVHLGVLTREVIPGRLRIPNEIMKQNVLCRIEKYLRHQESLQAKLGPANLDLRGGVIEPFAQLLEEFMSHRALRSLFTTSGATLQGIVEILLDPPRTRVSELRLIVDGAKKYGNGRFGFVDVFIVNDDGNAVILELKDIRLAGLFSAKQGRWIDKPPYHAMNHLDKEVSNMDENSLNEMAYMYWCEDKRQAIRTTVGQMRKDAMAQLERYMQAVKMGAVKSYSDSGVMDGRVKISETADPHALYGFVLMAVGGRRILWEAGNTILISMHSCLAGVVMSSGVGRRLDNRFLFLYSMLVLLISLQYKCYGARRFKPTPSGFWGYPEHARIIWLWCTRARGAGWTFSHSHTCNSTSPSNPRRGQGTGFPAQGNCRRQGKGEESLLARRASDGNFERGGKNCAHWLAVVCASPAAPN